MDILDRLERTRSETLGYHDLQGADLEKTYAPGKWSVRYILHHLADADSVLYDRIRRVLSEPRGVLWAYDQDAWAQKLGYDTRPLGLSRALYLAVRESVIFYARHHYEKDGGLEFIHSETGVRTLKDEFDKVARHNEHHLEQIRAALQLSTVTAYAQPRR